MPPRSFSAAVLLLAALSMAGCAAMSRKFTFMRPDVTRKEYTRTAPEYHIKRDKGRSNALAVNDRVALAEQRLREGKAGEAEAQAKAALKLDPKSADANTILAMAYEQRGQAQQAGGYYARAAELAPTRGGALNNYGAWLCSNGRAAESLTWFDRALADPGYATPASARANAGSCAVDAGQTARAQRDLRLALAVEPANPAALAAMARAEFASGRYLEARAFSERRLAAGPPTREILRLASQIEQKLGDNQAAARYMQQMATQFPQGNGSSRETGTQ